jgi:hypothetical protein
MVLLPFKQFLIDPSPTAVAKSSDESLATWEPPAFWDEYAKRVLAAKSIRGYDEASGNLRFTVQSQIMTPHAKPCTNPCRTQNKMNIELPYILAGSRKGSFARGTLTYRSTTILSYGLPIDAVV